MTSGVLNVKFFKMYLPGVFETGLAWYVTVNFLLMS
jgi:hypothetical protein